MTGAPAQREAEGPAEGPTALSTQVKCLKADLLEEHSSHTTSPCSSPGMPQCCMHPAGPYVACSLSSLLVCLNYPGYDSDQLQSATPSPLPSHWSVSPEPNTRPRSQTADPAMFTNQEVGITHVSLLAHDSRVPLPVSGSVLSSLLIPSPPRRSMMLYPVSLQSPSPLPTSPPPIMTSAQGSLREAGPIRPSPTRARTNPVPSPPQAPAQPSAEEQQPPQQQPRSVRPT